MYLKLKEIPLWAPKQLIQANMPKQFKDHYPSTRVILDATEIYIEQPKLPELQKMTFSSYKNHKVDSIAKAGLCMYDIGGALEFCKCLTKRMIKHQHVCSFPVDLFQLGNHIQH